MTDKKPEALRLADTLDLAPENGIEPQTSEDAAAELRRLHTENTALQQGYAAARLEIESMAEEHADELMVAHLDGRMRAAQQPGVATWTPLPGTLPEPGKPVLLDIGKEYPIRAMWAAKHTLEVGVEDDSGFGEYDEATGTYYCPEGWYEWNEHEEIHWAVNKTPTAWCELPQNGGASHGQAQALAAPQQEAPAMPSGWVSCTIEFDGSGPEEVAYGPKIMMDRLAKWLGKHFERTIAEKAAPQPSPAAQGDALDAARYRYLRDGDWRENDKLEPIIRLQLNSLWDAAIDAARAAQEGKSHDN